jgi:predicted nucleic acid-binding protein
MVYEVANAIWRHEHLLKDLADGRPHISALWGLIDSGKIAVQPSNEKLLQESYSIAKRNAITVYDAVFIALALEYSLPLKSFDQVQIRAFKSESNNKKHMKIP